MEYTYEVKTELNIIVRTDENSEVVSIPINEGNADYQRYLNPQAEQSTPIVTDEA